ncbi:uncharacterized protein C2845_PM16G18740 [Panicum miliaceum]|uniref:Uncharacterized protein n=1 Tax=Panicum miliaceum TaxID=4540 RepID=A0A3L6PYH7_PANMI|nr:uncharacterized protein C2845_PM16G18740 [Panicum miliaceum]
MGSEGEGRREKSEEVWVSVWRWGPGPEASADGGPTQLPFRIRPVRFPFDPIIAGDARICCGLFCTGPATGSGPSVAEGPARRAVHASAYDKNLEDQVRPAFVPDDVIGGAANPDKYWAPHPKTGVFGPAAVDAQLAAGAPDAAANGPGTVLDQKVWFRPLEDVEKPPPVA